MKYEADDIILNNAKELSKNSKKPTAFLATDIVINLLVGDKESWKILQAKGTFRLITSDFVLYEAICSLKEKEFSKTILEQFLELVQIVPSPKIPLTKSRIKHLRSYLKIK